MMDLNEASTWLTETLSEISVHFHKVPGSAIFIRYVQYVSSGICPSDISRAS